MYAIDSDAHFWMRFEVVEGVRRCGFRMDSDMVESAEEQHRRGEVAG